uniref:CCHC-type domain-containing protein n=1 Tax=Chenopodium quinoa TaxID=63459 RepID=A0A803N9Q3_CHEQI
MPKPLPPPYRKTLGRHSKNKRAKEPGEDREKQQVKRAKAQNKCSNCGALGHYKTKCQNMTFPTTNSKGGRPKKAPSPPQVASTTPSQERIEVAAKPSPALAASQQPSTTSTPTQ